ncbi:hypothetical protein [Butyricicoccus pullicaecorum]|uniref:hypothetical protein n=1 Tax=Butyricicoccus pullicaecorum TaxID=501571 RepID=UPI003520F645
MPDAFKEADFDADSWDAIPVPSCWQMLGYDRHQYTNIRYPFHSTRRTSLRTTPAARM